MLSRAASSTDAETFSTSTSSGSPRICILGGGFGGLYTAIKLESLIWPKGKKPQVSSQHRTAAAAASRWHHHGNTARWQLAAERRTTYALLQARPAHNVHMDASHRCMRWPTHTSCKGARHP